MAQETKLKPQSKTVAGHVFEFMAEVDEETGAYLWTKGHDEQFNRWLGKLWAENKDAFVVQGILVPTGVEDLIQDFLRRHPGGEKSDVIRAAALVYFDVLRDQKQVKRVEEIFNHADYQEKLKGAGRKTKVRFKPALYMDIEACASTFNLTPSKVVSEGLKRIMACYYMAVKNEYEQLVREIETRIESYLKAA